MIKISTCQKNTTHTTEDNCSVFSVVYQESTGTICYSEGKNVSKEKLPSGITFNLHHMGLKHQLYLMMA
jgi:hypothetical protein